MSDAAPAAIGRPSSVTRAHAERPCDIAATAANSHMKKPRGRATGLGVRVRRTYSALGGT
ncbi:hypothetical protein CSE6_010_19310 [Comamonas sp. E6]|nr:hypothetical protein CSE6_010_19310 [Comamonas sp. E6]